MIAVLALAAASPAQIEVARPPAKVAGEVVVRVELAVSPEGKVTDCRVIESDASPELQERSCALLVEKARYNPKRDADGKAVPTTITQTVRFRVEG